MKKEAIEKMMENTDQVQRVVDLNKKMMRSNIPAFT